MKHILCTSLRLVYRNTVCNWFQLKPSPDPSDLPLGESQQENGERFCYCFAFFFGLATSFCHFITWQSLVLLKVSFLSLLSDRPRRCCSNNDSWTQRKRDSEPPGEEHYCDDVHNHRDTQLAEVRQPDLCGVCLHLLHCADDHLAGMAGLLLHPAIPLRKCQRQKSGEQCWHGCLCFQKITMGFSLKVKFEEIVNVW